MSTKILPTPGLSSRPLTRLERFRELVLDLRWNRDNVWWRIDNFFHPLRRRRSRKNLCALVRALEAGSYEARPSDAAPGSALAVESLECTMQRVVFSPGDIKLRRHWWKR